MYFSSVEFTDFPPFAKGSRMEFSPVADKPDDLAEVHLITGENGTGKSRLLCLLAAALGEHTQLQTRCSNEGVAAFGVGIRPEDGSSSEAIMRLFLGKEGLDSEGTRSRTIHNNARLEAAFARSGLSYLEDADFTKAISDRALLEDALIFRPQASHAEPLLKKFHKVVVAARLGEDARMEYVVKEVEKRLGEVIGVGLSFAPRTVPVEELRLKWNGATLTISQCPEGLRSLIGWLLDAVLVMDALAANYHERMSRRLSGDEEAEEGIRKMKESLQLAIAIKEAEERIELIKSAQIPEELKDRDLAHWEPQLVQLRKSLEAIPLSFPAPKPPKGELNFDDIPCIILLDEIETHLHPGWQRQVLPAFQRMFPKAQIFVATHSPFVISSVNYGRVHILRRGEDGVRVETHEAKKGDSYMTAVQEVLGLTGWFDADIEKELGDFELLVDKAYTNNGTSEAEMRNRAAHFLKPENRYSEEVVNMVTNLVAQYEMHLEAKK